MESTDDIEYPTHSRFLYQGRVDYGREFAASQKAYARDKRSWVADVMKARLSAGIINKGDIEVVEAIYDRVHHTDIERIERLEKLAQKAADNE